VKIVEDSPPLLTALDRPNSYIGRSVPRPNMGRLLQGRAQFVTDVVLPRMAHVAFVRSPHAPARIKSIDAGAAKKSPGIIAVMTGAELSKVITPWVGVLTHLKGIKSAPQHAIAVDRACWVGEAVAAVVARTRAEAEDGCELVQVDYEELQAVIDPETALDAKTPVIHPDLGDNLCFERAHSAGDPDKGFADADAVVEATFLFGRHTGVCNEPRAIVADWNPSRLASPTATMPAGTRLSSRPPTAPQAAKRGSDNSENWRRRPAIPSTAEKITPPKNPGTASAGSGASNTLKNASHSGPGNSKLVTPMRMPTTAHPNAQVRPIPMAPRSRLSHFFIAPSPPSSYCRLRM
jgi:hypothetical protein